MSATMREMLQLVSSKSNTNSDPHTQYKHDIKFRIGFQSVRDMHNYVWS